MGSTVCRGVPEKVIWSGGALKQGSTCHHSKLPRYSLENSLDWGTIGRGYANITIIILTIIFFYDISYRYIIFKKRPCGVCSNKEHIKWG